MLAEEASLGRVLVLVTDGKDVSSAASERAGARRRRGRPASRSSPSGSPATSSRPCRCSGSRPRPAAPTATRPRAPTSARCSARSRAELERTWRLSYLTAARPGDRVRLETWSGSAGRASTSLVVPGPTANAAGPKPSRLLPAAAYELQVERARARARRRRARAPGAGVRRGRAPQRLAQVAPHAARRAGRARAQGRRGARAVLHGLEPDEHDRADVRPPPVVDERAPDAGARRRAAAHGRVPLHRRRLVVPRRDRDDGRRAQPAVRARRLRARRGTAVRIPARQDLAAPEGVREPAAGHPAHARGLAEGGPQLQAGPPDRRRRGAAAGQQGVLAGARRDAARPADGRRPRRHGAARQLEEPRASSSTR